MANYEIPSENACTRCPYALGCNWAACPHYDVPLPRCEKCGEEIGDQIYDVDGEILCEDCLKEMFRKVTGL